ncbi:MAG: methyltransferase domain-containing protein [Candidatus Dadabacteria bacterium]|nr:MAG: methyltransferase domain-containing protein [Candidatus Dadabacteria bacterium]
MDELLAVLKALAEPTRLRLLVLLSRCELTVTELTHVLEQSQPRISRHLRLLLEAGLLERSPEGPWAFYRLAANGKAAAIAEAVLKAVDPNGEPFAADARRLEAVRRRRAAQAARYFRENAARWDRIRRLYAGEETVERAMLEAVGPGPVGVLVDLGTGTGRILEVFAPRVERAVGIDQSHEMLTIARAKLDEIKAAHCQVRRGDVYNVPLPDALADVVTLHHVLHFLDDPAAAVREAARLLRPNGRLLIVDFAPHRLEFLRDHFQHRRLGFGDEEIVRWCEAAGLRFMQVRRFEARGRGKKLTACLWCAAKPAVRRRAVA